MKNRIILFSLIIGFFIGLQGCTKKHHSSHKTPSSKISKETPSPTTSPELPILSMPGEFAVAKGGKTVVVAQPMLGRVIEVSLKDSSARTITTTPAIPWGVAKIPNSENYIITDTYKGNLIKIDLLKGTERVFDLHINGTPVSVEITKNGSLAYVLFAEGYIAAVPMEGGHIRIIDTKINDPWGLALEKGEKTLLTCERGTNKLLRINIDSGEVTEVASIPRKATDVAVAFGGGYAYISFENGDLKVLNLNNGMIVNLTKLPGATTISEGTNMTEIFVSDFNNGKIYTVDVIEGKAAIIVEGLGQPTWLSYVDEYTLTVVDQTKLGGLYRIDFADQVARPTLLFEDGTDILSTAIDRLNGKSYISIEEGKIYEIPIEAPEKTKVFASELSYPSALHVSLDNKRLFVSLYDQTHKSYHLSYIDFSSKELRKLGNSDILKEPYLLYQASPNFLCLRDEKGILVYNLYSHIYEFNGEYLVELPGISGIACSWPYIWAGYYENNNEIPFWIYKINLSSLTAKSYISGYGVEPIGMDLSLDKKILFSSDIAGSAIVLFKL